jgi:SAM-dependent methyltransferase
MNRIDFYADIPYKDLVRAMFFRFFKLVSKLFSGRFVWGLTDVGNSANPEADLRNYYDAKNIRDVLKDTIKVPLSRACEIGSGYGRMTPVLHEFANEVFGFERESRLVEIAKKYVHVDDCKFINIDALTDITKYEKFNLIMTLTVLQHLDDNYVREVAKAIKDSTADNGFVLIVESTDLKSQIIGNKNKGDKFLSRPRSINEYIEIFSPLKLVAQNPRKLEASFGSNAGTLLLFHKS